MKSRRVSPEELQLLPGIVQDFLAGKMPDIPSPSIDGMEANIRRVLERDTQRDLLHQALKQQYIGMEISREVSANITALSEAHTFTVTTGHQCCLFTGPLFFVYKVLSAVKLAQTLSQKYTNYKFVPLLWMATEDHDFEEISSFSLPRKTIIWHQITGDAPVGRLKTQLDTQKEELEIVLQHSTYADELISLFNSAYCSSNTLAQATRLVVNHLFGKYGLVILDADAPEFKRQLIPVLVRDIFDQITFQEVSERNRQFAAKGWPIQVNPREINVFYMDRNGRRRILQTPEGFATADSLTKWTAEELRVALQESPEQFSPNVLLRPVYQELILPNLAYIGGPGELSYWFQLPKLFAQLGIPFPQLVMRNNALVISETAGKLMSQLGVKLNILQHDFAAVVRDFVLEKTGPAILLDEAKFALEKMFTQVLTKATAADPTLEKAAKAAYQKSLNEIEKLEKKMLRAYKRREDVSIRRLEKLFEEWQPGGIPQERYLNFAGYYAHWGPEFFEVLLSSFDAFPEGLAVLEE
ncbi:MAG: bacillithiol biosynthesis cysteine-adding enzyme BshC [Flavobacteriales bacterium]|nr:bacillithiol biosynthesis cysteine-adding enzyme BshC [Flavobacteriales bacterium]